MEIKRENKWAGGEREARERGKKWEKRERGLMEIRATFLGVEDHPEHRVGHEEL